jgi:hypothetical protein
MVYIGPMFEPTLGYSLLLMVQVFLLTLTTRDDFFKNWANTALMTATLLPVILLLCTSFGDSLFNPGGVETWIIFAISLFLAYRIGRHIRQRLSKDAKSPTISKYLTYLLPAAIALLLAIQIKPQQTFYFRSMMISSLESNILYGVILLDIAILLNTLWQLKAARYESQTAPKA